MTATDTRHADFLVALEQMADAERIQIYTRAEDMIAWTCRAIEHLPVGLAEVDAKTGKPTAVYTDGNNKLEALADALGIKLLKFQSDGCEWDPAANRWARAGDEHNATTAAQVMVGQQAFRLCKSCAALPRFKRLRKRKPID